MNDKQAVEFTGGWASTEAKSLQSLLSVKNTVTLRDLLEIKSFSSLLFSR